MATVMVVDDTDATRRVVSRILQSQGHQPVVAKNGVDALAMLQHVHPDVMLLDIMMPEMDGLTLLEILRGDPRYQALPVILMSALSEDEYKKRGERLGAKEYLVKSRFTSLEMLRHVDRYSQKH